jgi:hypothetical protein
MAARKVAATQPADIHEALFVFQQDPPTLVKSATNPHFKNKYVDLNQTVERVVGRLHELGVLVLQPMSSVGDKPALTTTFRHVASGTEVSETTVLTLDRVAPQAQGSAVTYARRYSLLSFLSLVGDADDDAEATRTTAFRPEVSSATIGGQQSDVAPAVAAIGGGLNL